MSCGSDWPVTAPDPLLGMHVAVNRRAPGATPDVEPLLPAEAMTVPQAIAGYTTGSAFVNRGERLTGRIEVGFAADLVAIDRDVLSGDPFELADTRVRSTYADGRQVFVG